MARETWIQTWLREWAEHELKGINAYPHEVTISRAMAGQLSSGTFGPGEPNGVELPKGWMRRLNHAMNSFNGTKKARYIEAVRRWYKDGPEKARAAMNAPESTMRRWVRRGEDLLRRALS